MENRSFEKDLPGGDPPQDPMDNPPGPSEGEPQAGPSGEQQKETEPTYSNTLDEDEDHESPPAYIQRHLPQEPKIDDIEELEQPAPLPIQEPHDVRLDLEFQQQARRRKEMRSRQLLGEGPQPLRPDFPPPPKPADARNPDPPPELADAANPCPPELADAANQGPPPEPEDQDLTPALPTAPLTWSERFQNMYKRICLFSFQFPFHTFLLSWPLATCTMGVVNVTLCRINLYLPYVMFVVGLFGTATIALRLYTLYFEERLTRVNTFHYWWWVRAAESIVWVFLVLELYLFFRQAPILDPENRRYCKWRYYKINRALMFLSSLTMLGWIVVNVTKLIIHLRRRRIVAEST